MSRASVILKELMQFAKYTPGKPIKGSDNKDIAGSTALAVNTSAAFDPDPQFGGHFITRYGVNDKVENFRITHEEAVNLVHHLKKHSIKSVNKQKSNPHDISTSSNDK